MRFIMGDVRGKVKVWKWRRWEILLRNVHEMNSYRDRKSGSLALPKAARDPLKKFLYLLFYIHCFTLYTH
jgi:hypothetical protein